MNIEQLNIYGEFVPFEVRETPKKYVEVARETVASYGDGVDLQHLLAVIIGSSATPEICGRLASYGIRQLSEMSITELIKEGLTKNASHQLVAAFKIAKCLMRSKNKPAYKINSPQDVSDYLMDKLRFNKQEHFYCLCLNTKNEIIHEKTIFVGSLNSSIVHPREVFNEAIRHASASIIVAHNHPSGNPSPSKEDIQVTKRLKEAGEVVGIELLDHIIIGDGTYRSLKEGGHI